MEPSPRRRRRRRRHYSRTSSLRTVHFTLIIIICFATLFVEAAEDLAHVLAFDLGSNSSAEPGLLEVRLGPADNDSLQQQVSLLAALYTNTEALMEVPAASLCTAPPIGTWNPIYAPSPDTVVVVGAGTGAGSVALRWNPQSGSTVNLTLRKGRGGGAMNVTVISSELFWFSITPYVWYG